MSVLQESLVQKFRNKRYRDAFVASRVRNWVAYQIRTIRNQRGWPQVKFAKKIGKPQSVISRLEDPNYGKLTVQTLLDLAATFNTALVIKFVDFPSFVRQMADVSTEAMIVDEYKGDDSPVLLRVLRLSDQVDSNEEVRGWFFSSGSDIFTEFRSNAGNNTIVREECYV